MTTREDNAEKDMKEIGFNTLTELISLRSGSVGDLLKSDQYIFCFHRRRGFLYRLSYYWFQKTDFFYYYYFSQIYNLLDKQSNK
jgi:hypothetical protein